MNKFNIYKIIFVITFLTLFSFGLVEVVLAQNIPAQCWTQEQCLGQAGSETENYFFVVGDADFQRECKGSENSQYGKCYVKPDEINLSVPIPDIQSGGTLTKVSQFPDYLKVVYTYFIYVIGIIAVAYIGWGGFEWMMAAGNAEKIGRAKDTIQGAFIGLLLAVGSYVLLGTINSRLVNIDYIRVERIKPNFLLNYCVDTESSQKWIKVGDESKTKVNKEDTLCNFTYYSEINPNNICQGLKCGDGTYCLAKLNTSGSSNAGFECVSLDDFDDRCNEMENPPSDCYLFDQYLQTIQKASNITEIDNKVCSFRNDILKAGVAFIPIVSFDFLQPDECVLTDIEDANLLSLNNYTFNRIPCSEGKYNNQEICLENGSPRVLKYWATGVPNPLTSNQIEVTCSDSPRAGKGTDSICILSKQSQCSVERPTTFYMNGYIRPDPLPDHDLPPFYWIEKPCTEYPPVGGSCNADEKCWVLMLNYYTPKF